MIHNTYACLDFVNDNRIGGPRARALQEALRELFSAAARDTRPSAAARHVLDAELSRCYRSPALARRDGGYELVWGADSPIAIVVRSAVCLLSSDELARVRVCAAEDCNWLFVDASKNGSRRWCDMNVCGNREKAKRFYARWS